MGLFTKKINPEELAKDWRTKLRGEMRGLDRQIREIERSEMKAKREVTQMARRGDLASAKIMATELARSRKAVERLHTSKAQINSVLLQLQTNMATIRLSGVMKDSTGVLTSMQEALNVPAVRDVMMQMSKEFTKAGLMEEMLDDVMDDALGVEDEDAVADDVVNKIVEEIVGTQFAGVGTVGVGVRGTATAVETAAPEAVESEAASKLAGRFAAL